MLANIDLIYDNAKLSEEFTKIYDLFYNKIICKYLNIEGLERLFNEKYMEFEWNMHLELIIKGIREIIIEIILSTRSEMHI